MKTLVIYHAACWDGFAAAWLLHASFPDAEFHAAQYGSLPPDVIGKRVIIADFSYPCEIMKQIMTKADSLVVLDHHRTAEAELAGIVEEFEAAVARMPVPSLPWSARPIITFDMGKSGGRLTWEYLWDNRLIPNSHLHENLGYQRDVVPWLVGWTEDRDLWRWKLPESREINAALRSYPLDFDGWNYLHYHGQRAAGWQELLSEGRAILRAERQIIDSHVSHAAEITLGDHQVLAVNATTLISEIAGELAKDHPFGATYFVQGDGQWVWSLRSCDGGVDVSEIAKRYGGGGHKAAAGFQYQGIP